MSLIGSYVQVLLTEFAPNPDLKWKLKDSAIYLVTSVVAKGQTQKHGITQVSQLVNVNDFFATQILPEVMSPLCRALDRVYWDLARLSWDAS